jgi:hypothetical protein
MASGAMLVSLIVAVGCGEGRPPVDASLTEATVKGVIKLKGTPAVGGGMVIFNASNVSRKVPAVSATIMQDGSYSLKTYRGGNEVKFNGPFMKEERGLALTSRYCEVDSGENVVNFDLLGPDDRARGAIYSDKAAKAKAKSRR